MSDKKLLKKIIYVGLPVLLFILFGAGIPVLLIFLGGGSLRDIITMGIFMVTLLTLGMLSAMSENIKQLIDSFYSYTFRLFFWLFVTLAPMMFFYWLSDLLVERFSLFFQVIFFLLWGGLLSIAVWYISLPSKRDQMFGTLEKLGRFSPVLYCFNVLMVAILFYSTGSYILAGSGFITFLDADGTALSGIVPGTGTIADFYLWHFLEAIPLLDINATLLWDVRLTYTDRWVGFFLLLFKITVIIPLIGAFAGYWKYRQAHPNVSDNAG